MRILFVAFPDSIHTARWINQVVDQGWDIHLAPSNEAPLHPFLKYKTKDKITFHPYSQTALFRGLLIKFLARWPFSRGSGYARRLALWLGNDPPDQWLDRIVQEVKPDIVHSMEIQHAGYLTIESRKRLGDSFPKWIVSNWGSDIYLFGRLAEHRERVREVLTNCDYYACECTRDIGLAKQLGLRGEVLPVLPCGGGFDLDYLQQFRQPGPTSARRIILLKGYQNWAGRALAGLRAIAMCADLLVGYRVLIQLAPPDVILEAELISHSTGIPIEIAAYSDYTDVMRRFGSARIHIGLSISDGISQSLLESMVMGAFPIQSCTACADEWIEDGISGLIVPPDEPYRIAEALRRALTDDTLVDQATRINDETVQKRLAAPLVKSKAVEMYRSIFAS